MKLSPAWTSGHAPNVHALFSSHGKCRLEVTPVRKIIVASRTASETDTFQPSPDGRILIGDNTNGRFIVVNAEGMIQREIKLWTAAKEHGIIASYEVARERSLSRLQA